MSINYFDCLENLYDFKKRRSIKASNILTSKLKNNEIFTSSIYYCNYGNVDEFSGDTDDIPFEVSGNVLDTYALHGIYIPLINFSLLIESFYLFEEVSFFLLSDQMRLRKPYLETRKKSRLINHLWEKKITNYNYYQKINDTSLFPDISAEYTITSVLVENRKNTDSLRIYFGEGIGQGHLSIKSSGEFSRIYIREKN